MEEKGELEQKARELEAKFKEDVQVIFEVYKAQMEELGALYTPVEDTELDYVPACFEIPGVMGFFYAV